MKILILGIGNILFGDEGVGAHFVHYLDEKYDFVGAADATGDAAGDAGEEAGACELNIIDGGTLAHALIPLICAHDRVLLIDCLDAAGAAPGEIFYFPFSAMPAQISWQGSAHELETLQTLQMMRTHGDMPPVQILGIIPRRIGSDPTFALSAEMLAAAPAMEKIVAEFLCENCPQIAMQQRSSVSLEQLCKITYKRQMRR